MWPIPSLMCYKRSGSWSFLPVAIIVYSNACFCGFAYGIGKSILAIRSIHSFGRSEEIYLNEKQGSTISSLQTHWSGESSSKQYENTTIYRGLWASKFARVAVNVYRSSTTELETRKITKVSTFRFWKSLYRAKCLKFYGVLRSAFIYIYISYFLQLRTSDVYIFNFEKLSALIQKMSQLLSFNSSWLINLKSDDTNNGTKVCNLLSVLITVIIQYCLTWSELSICIVLSCMKGQYALNINNLIYGGGFLTFLVSNTQWTCRLLITRVFYVIRCVINLF